MRKRLGTEPAIESYLQRQRNQQCQGSCQQAEKKKTNQVCPIRSRPPEQTEVQCKVTIGAEPLSSHHVRSKSSLMRARWIAPTATAPLLNVIAPNMTLNAPRMPAAYADRSNSAPKHAIIRRRVVPAPETENHGRERSRSMCLPRP